MICEGSVISDRGNGTKSRPLIVTAK